jgi:hypothetical protein
MSRYSSMKRTLWFGRPAACAFCAAPSERCCQKCGRSLCRAHFVVLTLGREPDVLECLVCPT